MRTLVIAWRGRDWLDVVMMGLTLSCSVGILVSMGILILLMSA